MIVSDPSYDKDKSILLGLGVKIDKIAKGQWTCFVAYDSKDQIVVLRAEHKDFDHDGEWKLKKVGSASVDSGQMSIVDIDYYQDDQDVKGMSTHPDIPQSTHGRWYSVLCKKTSPTSGPAAGVFKHGCVSSSGEGDGVYGVYVQTGGKSKTIHAIEVCF